MLVLRYQARVSELGLWRCGVLDFCYAGVFFVVAAENARGSSLDLRFRVAKGCCAK